jgi:DNA-directed RNA polymerase subunit RPC12/RpoP
MTIAFLCPSCQKKLNAPDRKAGKQSTCPGCRIPVIVSNSVSSQIIPRQQSQQLSARAVLMYCPHCGKQMSIPANIMGGPVRCPACQNITNTQIMQPTPVPTKLWLKAKLIFFTLVGVFALVAAYLMGSGLNSELKLNEKGKGDGLNSNMKSNEKDTKPNEKKELTFQEFSKSVQDKKLLGRPFQEVRDIMGAPDEIQANGNFSTWMYNLDQGLKRRIMITFNSGVCSEAYATDNRSDAEKKKNGE